MSFFTAIWNRDGRPCDAAIAQTLSKSFEKRGQCEIWCDNSHILLAPRHKSSLLNQGAPSLRLIVAGDIRLDNRDDLARRLGIDSTMPSDTALVAAAFRIWQEDCPRHLLGDFAFCIWDECNQRMFAARDGLGVRPFYYHLSTARFFAATTPMALLALGIDAILDETAIADFVSGGFTDKEIAFHQSIRRLPPGHSLTVTADTAKLQRYWQLEIPDRYVGRDGAEQFAALFTSAIERRTSEAVEPGVMLSGGLDSSSIAMIAQANRDRPLPAISMTFDRTTGWSDGAHIHSMLDAGRFAPTLLPSDDHDPLADIQAMIAEQGGPFLGYNSSVTRQVYHAAAGLGIDVLLDGHGGDEVVSHGMGRLNELAAAGQWSALMREAQGIGAIYGMSGWQVMSPYLDHAPWIRRMRRRWRMMQSRLGLVTAPPPDDPAVALVNPALAQRSGSTERHRAQALTRRHDHKDADLQLAMLDAPLQPYAFEMLDRLSVAAGVRSTFPFYDRQLVEFSLSLPSDYKLRNGYPRFVMREAMKGILPDPVRLRRDKFDFTAQLAAGLLRHRQSIEARLTRDRWDVGQYVDMDVARRCWSNLLSSKPARTADVFPLWRTVILSTWLESLASDKKTGHG